MNASIILLLSNIPNIFPCICFRTHFEIILAHIPSFFSSATWRKDYTKCLYLNTTSTPYAHSLECYNKPLLLAFIIRNVLKLWLSTKSTTHLSTLPKWENQISRKWPLLIFPDAVVNFTFFCSCTFLTNSFNSLSILCFHSIYF